LKAQETKALAAWVGDANEVFEVAFPTDDKRVLVNLAYIALCEYVGPVKADQLLSESIKQTEPLANQQRVNLHAFL